MTRITTTLAGFGLALGLLALPIGVAADGTDDLKSSYASHRFYFSEEEIWQTRNEPLASYAMVELTELEAVAGRQYLDTDTIKFLEDNLWVQETVAFPAEAEPKRLTQEEIQFLEDNIWEQETVARTARIEPQPLTDEELSILGEELWGHGSTDEIAGDPDDTDGGVYGIDPGFYSDEMPWQDQVEPMAGFAESENTGIGVYAIDPDMFSEEIAWQDVVVEGVARPQAVAPTGIFPMPYDAPQLRSEDFLNY